ncbi:MAG: hypothetical protein WCD51_06015, partial [Anaerolineae bacterium]
VDEPGAASRRSDDFLSVAHEDDAVALDAHGAICDKAQLTHRWATPGAFRRGQAQQLPGAVDYQIE